MRSRARVGSPEPAATSGVTWPSASDHNAGDFQSSGASTAGDEPKFFDQLPGTNSGQGSGYNARYPFGFGLSYTTFTTSGLSVTGSVSKNGSATATFTVANTGTRAGATVEPVYVRQPVSESASSQPLAKTSQKRQSPAEFIRTLPHHNQIDRALALGYFLEKFDEKFCRHYV